MNRRNATLSGLWFLLTGCNLLTMPKPAPDETDTKPDAPEVQYTDDDYFAFMAKMLEADQFASSDQIVLTADRLKATGTIKDVSRLSEVRRKRIDPIRDADKPALLQALQGD